MNLLRDSYRGIALDIKRFEECLDDLRQHRAWEKAPITKPYGSEEQMLAAELDKSLEEAGAIVDMIARLGEALAQKETAL